MSLVPRIHAPSYSSGSTRAASSGSLMMTCWDADRSMITQLRLEFLKLVRSRSFLLSFVALSTFVALMLWGFYTYAERKAGEGVTSDRKSTRLNSSHVA